MSGNSPEADQDDANGLSQARALPETLACNGCRKAKLKCSRERPTCSHCRKTGVECIYETKRAKPGLKAGAVENLHRRLDNLEKLVQSHEKAAQSCEQNIGHSTTSDDSAAYRILALLANELPKLVQPTDKVSAHEHPQAATGSFKRRRLSYGDSIGSPAVQKHPALPIHDVLESIISAYFTHIHPWIPMLHQARFRQRLVSPTERPKLELVLHAMVFTASKFLSLEKIGKEVLSISRKYVVVEAMETVSPENLQALTIVAFTDIGNGDAPKAWAIVGSLTRTVEYSQLTQEHDCDDYQPFCRPYYFLDEPDDWTEIEERRRIFWNIFNLDRFCSIAMGWNTSLTSDDVHRRLPCDGPLWRKCTPVVTPYFGIWDKSAGRIGNPVAFLPQYHSPAQPANDVTLQNQPEVTASASPNQNLLTDTTIGAFAYCTEATESMSRITSYFLQQKINLRDEREINSWLTRFKELDLRLVHWKMLLPQKWKTNMERQSTLMDPNLTTAHVTHNASMILLHQLIAYPPSTWGFRNRLPSYLSGEACHSAGIEIAKITQNYLAYSPESSPVGVLYAFCVYVAGRMLLIHWKYQVENVLANEFWSLVRSLEEMSRRWNASSSYTPGESDLFAKYASKLRELYELCNSGASFHMNVMDYTNEINHFAGSPPRPENSKSADTHSAGLAADPLWVFETSTRPWRGIGVPGSPQPTIHPARPEQANMGQPEDIANGIDLGEFNTIPEMMLDQQFMNMDRVITFDDGSMFAAALEHGAW